MPLPMFHRGHLGATPRGCVHPTLTCSTYLIPVFLYHNRNLGRSTTRLRGGYARDFRLADEAFRSGQLEAISNKREMRWRNWCTYVKLLGVDPYLQQVSDSKRVRCLTGFAARTRTGFYGHGRQVQSSMVTGPITAIGQMIVLACNKNPTKVLGSEKFLPALQIMIDGYTKADPPTQKKITS